MARPMPAMASGSSIRSSPYHRNMGKRDDRMVATVLRRLIYEISEFPEDVWLSRELTDSINFAFVKGLLKKASAPVSNAKSSAAASTPEIMMTLIQGYF